MNRISFFDVVKEETAITGIFRNEDLAREIEGRPGCAALPEVMKHYGFPVAFPKAPDDRPYIFCSIALSADGKMAYMDNKKGYLIAGTNIRDREGASLDFWCLNFLRAYADGLLIGANTLRNEPGVLNHVVDRKLNEERKTVLGKTENPVNIIVSLDGTDVPWDHATFDVDPADRLKLVIATSPAGWEYIRENCPKKTKLLGAFQTKEDADAAQMLPSLADLYADFDEYPVIVTGEGAEPDTKLFLYVLRKIFFLNDTATTEIYTAVLLKNACLDEHFTTYSMVYAGGTMSPGAIFPQECFNHAHADLLSLGIHNCNFLYSRQKLVYGLKGE